LSARNLEDEVYDEVLLEKLIQLTSKLSSLGSASILQQIDEKKSDSLARDSGFDLVEGGYYRAIAFDYLSNPKSSIVNLSARY
jgi:hypothetical protein